VRPLLGGRENRNRAKEKLGKRICVKNLKKSTREWQLFEYFNTFGQVESVELLRNRMTQESRKVAYVQFHNKEAAKNCLNYLGEIIIEGRAIKCEQCLSRLEAEERKVEKCSYLNKAMRGTIYLLKKGEFWDYLLTKMWILKTRSYFLLLKALQRNRVA